jgi:hypothetical protein
VTQLSCGAARSCPRWLEAQFFKEAQICEIYIVRNPDKLKDMPMY